MKTLFLTLALSGSLSAIPINICNIGMNNSGKPLLSPHAAGATNFQDTHFNLISGPGPANTLATISLNVYLIAAITLAGSESCVYTQRMQAPRPLGLTLVLCIVGIAGLAALTTSATRPASVLASFPRLSQEIHFSILASLLLGLWGIYGIFQWRRWGLLLFSAAAAAYFGLEYYALEGNPRTLRVLMAMILVGMNALPLWWRFR